MAGRVSSLSSIERLLSRPHLTSTRDPTVAPRREVHSMLVQAVISLERAAVEKLAEDSVA